MGGYNGGWVSWLAKRQTLQSDIVNWVGSKLVCDVLHIIPISEMLNIAAVCDAIFNVWQRERFNALASA